MKKILIIIIGAVGLLAALIIFTCVVVFSVLNNQKNADYYELGDDQIPSVKYVVGERKINGVSTKIENGVQIKEYTYISESSTDDISQYAEYIVENEGFAYQPGIADSFSPVYYKKSTDEGKILMLHIIDTPSGFTLTVQKQEGSVPEIK